jgi:hypothetical protein
VTAEQYARYAARLHWITLETTWPEELSYMWGDADENCDDSLTQDQCGDEDCCHTPYLHRYALLEIAAHDSHRDGIANRYISTFETEEGALNAYCRVASSHDAWFAPVAIIDLDTNVPMLVGFNDATHKMELVDNVGFIRPSDLGVRWAIDNERWRASVGSTKEEIDRRAADATPTLAFTLV